MQCINAFKKLTLWQLYCLLYRHVAAHQ